MDLKQFEYVLTINEERSFSKAAKKLFISQPSLSQYISRLEGQLGVTIFDRNTSPLTLTYEGELYIETALNIISIMENLQKKFDDVSDLKTGRINIGLTPSKANYPLPAILPVFKEKYPGIEAIITEASSSELEDMLTHGAVDICIMNLPLKSKNLEYEEILTENIYIAAPPNYNEKSFNEKNCNEKNCNETGEQTSDNENEHPFIDIKALADEQFILLHPDQRLRQIADKVFVNAGIKPKIMLETSGIETSLRLSAAGMGFCFVPESYTKASGLAGKPKLYTFGEPAFAWTLVLAYRQNAYRTKAVTAFADTVKELLCKQ